MTTSLSSTARSYLIRDGRPVFLIGLNYWPRATGPLMWQRWDPVSMERELEEMRGLGLNVCRSFLMMPDFMPEPGCVDPVMLDRFRQFLALCGHVGIWTIPTLFVGHMSGENWDLPWRGGRDFWSDPWLLDQEFLYVQSVVRQAGDADALFGWLLTNEITNYLGDPSPPAGRRWAAALYRAIRDVDPLRPIGLGDGSWELRGEDNGLRLEELSDLVDFFGPHTYDRETDALRHSYQASFLTRLADYGKPVLLEEFGCSTAFVAPEHQADYYRTVLHSVLLAGGTGALGWCFSDFELPNQRPYSHHPFELRFGVTCADGTPKPAAGELQRFARLLDAVDLTSYSLPESQVGIVVPSHRSAWRYPFWGPDTKAMNGVLLQAYTLAHQAQLDPCFFREPPIPMGAGAPIVLKDPPSFPPHLRLLVLPHCQTLTAPGFEALLDYAARSGTVYYSYHTDLGAHNFEQLFGCRIQTRWGLVDSPSEEVRILFELPFGGIEPGEEFFYRPAGQYRRSSYCPVVPTAAEVIARDNRGRPALLSHRVGRGRVLFGTYPLEYYLWNTPEAHLSDRTHRLYQALGEVAGVRRRFRVDDPMVQVGWLESQDDCLIWLINHSWEPRVVSLVAEGPHLFRDLEDGQATDSAFPMPPKGVRVLRANPVSAGVSRSDPGKFLTSSP